MRALIGVELLRRLPGGPVDIRDTKLKGFVLRVRASGTHTYFANYARGRWKVLGTTQTLTAPEARNAARDVLGDAMQGGDPIGNAKAAEARQLTFDNFVTDHYEPWAIAHRRRGAEAAYRLRRIFGPLFDHRPLSEITGFEIERWRSSRLDSGTKPVTVNRDLAVIRAALSRAVEWRFLDKHPLARVKQCKTDRRGIVRYLDPDEEKRLLAALTARDDERRADRARANTWRRERGYAEWPEYGTYTDHLHPLVLLALHTGARRGELFQLRWADVDLVRPRVTLRGDTTKAAQTRYVPLNSIAATALTTWHAIATPQLDALVFPGAENEPLDNIKTSWGALLKRAKITAFRFHDCRHHFASALVMRGVDLNIVRELLGHGDFKMTLRYAHLSPSHTAAAVAQLTTPIKFPTTTATVAVGGQS
jgi:integrase